MMPWSVSGKRELVGRALLRIQLDELLGVERIAARPLEQGLLGFGREQRSAQEAPDQLCGLLVGQRGERERRGVELAAAPARAAFEELGPRRRDDEQRDVRDPVDELVEEVEEALVRPVDVLDDDDERTLLGETLEEAAPGGEGLVSAIASQLCVAGEAEEREEMRLDARLVARAGERVLDDLVDLRRDVLRRVLLQNARLRLDDLAERPERDPVTVGKAASLAPGDELRVGLDDAIQLVDKPALADSRDADEREELRRALVPRSLERVPDDAELALATDELGARLVRDVDPEARVGGGCQPHRDRLRLALRLDRSGVVVVDGGAGRPVGRLVDDDAVDRRGTLEASGCVHDVARGHALACVGAGVERDQRLAGGDPDAELEAFLGGEVADRERRPDCALGVVLVRGRGSEERHDRVADELLDGAAMSFELGANALVVGAQESLDVLRIHRLGA